MKRLYGNIGGLKASQTRRLEALYRRRVPIQHLISLQLLREISRLSREMRRQIGLMIDRTGRVTHVIVGDYQKIVIPDLAGYRLAPGRLKGLRCVHTHLTEEAFWESLDLFHGPVWASHCNCRALVNRQRQLSDRQLRALFDRNAVIGLLRPDIGKDAVLKTK